MGAYKHEVVVAIKIGVYLFCASAYLVLILQYYVWVIDMTSKFITMQLHIVSMMKHFRWQLNLSTDSEVV